MDRIHAEERSVAATPAYGPDVGLLDRQSVLVAMSGPIEHGQRHVQVRLMLCDAIEGDPRFGQLLTAWHDPEMRVLAAKARTAFAEFLVATGLSVDDVEFAFHGRLVGRIRRGQHALDEPPPPSEWSIAAGKFTDQLVAGEATLGDLAALFELADSTPQGAAIDVDLRTPMPLGTLDKVVELDSTGTGRQRRDPLETILADIDHLWGDPADRHREAIDFLTSIDLGWWPFLAGDLGHRYGAQLLGEIRGEPPLLDYRLGDASLGGPEPPDLGIPEFVPTGNAATDRERLRRWRERLNQVEAAVASAARAGERQHRRTRPMRPDELAGYKRDVAWLYENRANRTSMTIIAERDLGSRYRWRDVQKGIRRIRRLLDAGATPKAIAERQEHPTDDLPPL
jgi:hypothetical protein